MSSSHLALSIYAFTAFSSLRTRKLVQWPLNSAWERKKRDRWVFHQRLHRGCQGHQQSNKALFCVARLNSRPLNLSRQPLKKVWWFAWRKNKVRQTRSSQSPKGLFLPCAMLSTWKTFGRNSEEGKNFGFPPKSLMEIPIRSSSCEIEFSTLVSSFGLYNNLTYAISFFFKNTLTPKLQTNRSNLYLLITLV